jgi:hypothetical protein
MLSIPMTDAQFAAASTRLRADGIILNGPTGTLTRDGITATYAHADGKLTIEIVDRPFLFPVSMIEEKLKAYIEQASVVS